MECVRAWISDNIWGPCSTGAFRDEWSEQCSGMALRFGSFRADEVTANLRNFREWLGTVCCRVFGFSDISFARLAIFCKNNTSKLLFRFAEILQIRGQK